MSMLLYSMMLTQNNVILCLLLFVVFSYYLALMFINKTGYISMRKSDFDLLFREREMKNTNT